MVYRQDYQPRDAGLISCSDLLDEALNQVPFSVFPVCVRGIYNLSIHTVVLQIRRDNRDN